MQLNNCEKFIIDSTTNESSLDDIKRLLENIETTKPKKIFGLGEYDGKDKEYLRIETLAKNKFRNAKIGTVESYEISKEFNDQKIEGFKIATAMGNSFCNLSSYRIAEYIKNNNLNIQTAFIHIPKRFNIDKAINLIQDLTKSL